MVGAGKIFNDCLGFTKEKRGPLPYLRNYLEQYTMHFKPHVEKVISIISNYTVSQMVSDTHLSGLGNPASATTTPKGGPGNIRPDGHKQGEGR